MTADDFDRLADSLQSAGPRATVDLLCERLRSERDYQNLFYALLMRKRIDLGVSPFPMGSSSELPPETHAPYEATIRDAAREVGTLYLSARDLPRAWGYFRLIGEPQPVKDALATHQPNDDEDIYPLIDIAWHQQVLPKKGFDWLLNRQGICSTITMVSSSDLSHDADLRNYCVGQLVRSLHEQLQERLTQDLQARGLPIGASLPEKLRDELFGEDVYHIDISHLSSVVQMALQLPRTERDTLSLARELCLYGQRLAPQFQGHGDAPFEENYQDYGVYLDVLLEHDTDAGLAHFESKIARELEEGNTFPAEVYVNLLVKLGRNREALAAAKRAFANLADDRGLSCPSVSDLAREVGEYEELAAKARERGDVVTFLAGLVAAHAK
jgi:hypothetical protein